MKNTFPTTPRFSNRGGTSSSNLRNASDLLSDIDQETGTGRGSDQDNAFINALGDMESIASLDASLEAGENGGEDSDLEESSIGAFQFLRKSKLEPKEEVQEKKVKISGSGGDGNAGKRRLFKVPDSEAYASIYCFKTIGEGATFCTATKCQIQHKGKRLPLTCGCAYIKGVQKNTAFVDPFVNTTLLEEDLSDDWLSSSKTKEEWNDLFTKVRALARENMGFKLSSDDLEYEANVSSFAKNVQTPFRKNASKVKNEKVERLGTLDQKLGSSIFESLGSNNKANTIAEVVDLVTALDSKLKLLGASFVNVHQLVSEDHIALNNFGIKVETEVDRFDSEIGVRPPNLHSLVDAPNLWSTIGLLSNLTVSAHDSTLDFATAIKDVTNQGNGYTDGQLNSFKHSSFNPLANSVKNMQSDVSTISNTVGDMEKFAMTAGKRIKELRQSVQNFTPTPIHSVLNQTQPTSGFNQNWNSQGFEDRLQKLGEDVVSLKKQGDSRVIKFRSLGFLNNKDSTAFLQTEQALDDFGYVVDFHMVMEHIYHATMAEDMLSQMDKSNKLSLDDLNQTYSIMSFQTSMPKIFDKTGGFNIIKNNESHFSTVKTFDDWDLIHDGYRALLKQALISFSDSHSDAIDRRLDPTTDYYNLAKLSLAESVLFVDGLINYIDDVYREYVQARFGPRKAWHIATRLARALVLQVAKPRDGVYKLFKNRNLGQISSEMFYVTLRALDEMAEIRRFNYKNTPVVSSELVKFLATNTDYESVRKLVVDHTSMTTQIKKLSDDQTALTKTLSTYHNKLSEMTNEFKQTKNELVNLQKKLKAKNVV